MKAYAFHGEVIKKHSSFSLALSQITPCGGSNYPSMGTQTAMERSTQHKEPNPLANSQRQLASCE